MDETITKTEERKSSPEEEPGGILVAEQLAYAQTELEHRLLRNDATENIDEEVSSTLAKYPAAESFRPLFDEAVNAYEEAEEWVDSFWSSILLKRELLESSAIFPGLGFKEASTSGSRRAAEYLFSAKIDGQVSMLRNRFSLIFVINPTEFQKIYDDHFYGPGSEDQPGASELAGGYFMMEYGMPVIVLREEDGEDLYYNLVHELSHVGDYLLEVARTRQTGEHLSRVKGTLDKKTIKRLVKSKLSASEQEDLLKKEIFAYFTIAELNDLISIKNPAYPARTPEEVEAFALDVVEEAKHTDSIYHTGGHPVVRKGEEAARALAEVRELYRQTSNVYAADKICVNLLQQFPLKSWHAVANMLKKAHAASPPATLELEW